MEGEHGPTVTEVPSGAAGRLIHFLRSYLTLPRTHSIIGIVAGCLSISLGLYSYLHLAKPVAYDALRQALSKPPVAIAAVRQN